MALMR